MKGREQGTTAGAETGLGLSLRPEAIQGPHRPALACRPAFPRSARQSHRPGSPLVPCSSWKEDTTNTPQTRRTVDPWQDRLGTEPHHEPPLGERPARDLEALITRAIRHLHAAISFDTRPENVAHFDTQTIRRVRTLHRAAVALGW